MKTVPYSAKQIRDGYLTGVASVVMVATWSVILLSIAGTI